MGVRENVIPPTDDERNVLVARKYQIELFERAKKDNVIAALDTGKFKIEREHSGYSCQLTLPSNAPFRTESSHVCESRHKAKKVAAFKACIRLYNLKALNDHLLPEIEWVEEDHEMKPTRDNGLTTENIENIKITENIENIKITEKTENIENIKITEITKNAENINITEKTENIENIKITETMEKTENI
ncbi:4675_t:CDS:2, partial [Entrophospora sp. SA101]